MLAVDFGVQVGGPSVLFAVSVIVSQSIHLSFSLASWYWNDSVVGVFLLTMGNEYVMSILCFLSG